MREIKPQSIALQRASWHDSDGHPQLVVSGLLGFSLLQPRQFLNEDAVWQLFSKYTTEHSVCDLWMAKPCGEVLVWGHAHSHQPTTKMEVGVSCGPVSRRLQVSGDRHWQPSLLGWKATAATPFTSMPLAWERSFGGAGWGQCPLGVGFDSISRLAMNQVAPLPNIEAIGDTMRTPESRSRSVSFAPVWPTWVDTKHRGTFDNEWLANGFPGMPPDFDSSMFNLAQPEQRRKGFWTGDEPYKLEGLHPSRSQIDGRLPEVRMRCFAAYASGVSEVPMHLDTVAFFPSQEVGVLIFRGVADNVGVDARNLTGLMAAAEWSEYPRSKAHYHSEFSTRLASYSPYSFPDEPLMPQVPQPETGEVNLQPQPAGVAAQVATTVAVVAMSTAPDVLSAPAILDTLDLGLLTQDPTSPGQSAENQSQENGKPADAREVVLGELSRASFLEEAKACLGQIIDSLHSLVSVIEQQPDRDIAELIAEQVQQGALGTTLDTEAMRAANFDWREWVPPKLAQRDFGSEERAQFAAQLRGWIAGAQSTLNGLGEHAHKAEGLLQQLQQTTPFEFSELLNSRTLQQFLSGENGAQLQKLIQSLGSPLDSQQAVQLMQTGISDWKSGVDSALAAQDTWNDLLDPSALRTWVLSLAGVPVAASQALQQPMSPLVAAFRSSLSEGMGDAQPEGIKKAFADMAQAWSEEEGLDAEIESALSNAKEVRSTDDLLQLIDRLSSPPGNTPIDNALEESLQATAAQTGTPAQDTAEHTSNRAQEDLKQLRSDAVSEPVFAASAAVELLRKLVTEQAAAGESLAGRDFAGADFRDLNFEGIDLTGALLEGANLSGANLRNAKLCAAVMINANLRRADLSGAQATGTNLRNILAEESVWRSAHLQSCELTGADLKHTDFQCSVLNECDFSDADLGHADLSQTHCVLGKWTKARLRDARLSKVHWSDCNLSSAILDGMQAEDSQLRFCDFTDASGPGASLGGSTLEGSRFLAVQLPGLNASRICAPGSSWVQSSLPGASFKAAELSHALLSEADLANTIFDEADLQGAVLNASLLTYSSFIGAKLALASMRAADACGATFVDCDLQGADINGTVIDGCDFTRSQLHALQLRVTHQPT